MPRVLTPSARVSGECASLKISPVLSEVAASFPLRGSTPMILAEGRVSFAARKVPDRRPPPPQGAKMAVGDNFWMAMAS